MQFGIQQHFAWPRLQATTLIANHLDLVSC